VSLGAAVASSSTSIASRPCLVMRSAIGPLSTSRRQTGSRAIRWDFLQQAGADELVDDLSGGFALDVRRQFNSSIIALRSSGQNDELRIGKSCHRDPPLRWCGTVRRHHHSPTLAMQPAGQDPLRLEQAHYRSVRIRMPVLSG
jgi:hypothetical protein